MGRSTTWRIRWPMRFLKQQEPEDSSLPHWLVALASDGSSGEVLTGGRNNQGVVLHRLGAPNDDRDLGPGNRPRQLIEKRSRLRREARLHGQLQRWQQCNPAAALFPQVYGVLPAVDGYRLFQAYVPHEAVVPSDPVAAGRLLARLAFDFHQTMAQVCHKQPPTVARVLHRQQQKLAAAAGLRPDGLDAQLVGSLMDRLLVRLSDQGVVWSHNDLHWSNIRASTTSPEPHHQLIDLGRAGWNLPGAEFHVALRQSLLGDHGPPIWLPAIDRYAALSGGDAWSLRLGSLWFALVHGAGLLCQLAPAAPDRIKRREERLFTRLLSRITSYLDARPSSPL